MECATFSAVDALANLGGALLIVVMLASVAEAIVEFTAGRLWDKFNLDKFYLPYISGAVAFALVFVSGQNLLVDYLPATPAMIILGRVLTSILAARGANWVHDFFSNRRKEVELKIARLKEVARRARQ